MNLEVYQLILLVLLGILVGISMSFVGQTGQGVVIPMVLLISEDILLAIAISVLNDLITASAVSIGYVRNKQLKIRKDTLILVAVAFLGSFIGVLILMTTPLGTIFGWGLPLFIIATGLVFIRNGFPTTESLKNTVRKISLKYLKKKGNEEKITEFERKLEAQTLADLNEIEGIIPSGSRLFYILAIGLGLYVGLNSGMFGANSGFILTLVLVMLYGYPLKKGVGTALLLSIMVCISTFIIYQILGSAINSQFYANFDISLFLAIGSVPTGIIASSFIQKISAKAMGRGMAVVMMILGTISLIFYFVSN